MQRYNSVSGCSVTLMINLMNYQANLWFGRRTRSFPSAYEDKKLIHAALWILYCLGILGRPFLFLSLGKADLAPHRADWVRWLNIQMVLSSNRLAPFPKVSPWSIIFTSLTQSLKYGVGVYWMILIISCHHFIITTKSSQSLPPSTDQHRQILEQGRARSSNIRSQSQCAKTSILMGSFSSTFVILLK